MACSDVLLFLFPNWASFHGSEGSHITGYVVIVQILKTVTEIEMFNISLHVSLYQKNFHFSISVYNLSLSLVNGTQIAIRDNDQVHTIIVSNHLTKLSIQSEFLAMSKQLFNSERNAIYQYL